MKTNFKQTSDSNCGISVITTAINHLTSRNFSLNDIIIDNELSDHWFSFEEIKEVVGRYDIYAVGYKSNFREIIDWNKNNGYILLTTNEIGQSHYVYVFEKNKSTNEFEIADPANKFIVWIPEAKLEAMYAGRILILKKKHKSYSRKSPRDYFKKYKPWGSLLKTKKFYLLITFILQIMLNVALLFSNNFVRCFMNNASILLMDNLKSIFIGFSIIYLVHIILNGIIQLILKNISNAIYKDAIRIFLNWFTNISNEEYDKISYDLWIQKIAQIKKVISFEIFLIIKIPNDFIFSILTLFVFSKLKIEIALLAFFEIFLIFLISLLFEMKIKNNIKLLEYDQKKFNIKMQDLVYGQKFVRAKNYQQMMQKKIMNEFNLIELGNLNISKKILFRNIISSVIHRMMFLVVFIMSSLWITRNEIIISDLIYFSLLGNYIVNLSDDIKEVIITRPEINMYLNELSIMFNNKNEIVKRNHSKKIFSLRILNVSKWINNREILKVNSKNITKNTFIYGMNGIGKSTMLQIIAGLYKNYEGTIAINNELVVDLSRENIIYLDQFDYLFTGKVIDNFIGSNLGFNYNYFYEHKLDELLNMYKLSLDSPIINNGSNLSKGQRQIISFLSLLFIERDVYVIDEALSNVENKLKTFLLKILLVEKKDKLIIYCDHDKENINLFDDVWEIK